MAKYYVESGSVQSVVDSIDFEGAALSVVDSVMSEMDSLDLFDELSPTCESEVGSFQYLDGTIRVSEQGFGRDDAKVLKAEDVIQEWFELYQALSRIQNLLLDDIPLDLEACILC